VKLFFFVVAMLDVWSSEGPMRELLLILMLDLHNSISRGFLFVFSSQALSLSSEYQGGKLLAYQLLCKITLRQHDIELPSDHLLRFYMALHHGLVHSDEVCK
jgi:hypothetical protein